MTPDVQNTLLVIVAVGALALVIQTIGMIVVAITARNAVKNMRDEMREFRSSVTPILNRTREVVENVAPKVEEAAGQLNVIVKTLCVQTADIQSAADDIIDRTRHQVGRVDHMLTLIFDRVEKAGSFMSDAVAKPMRQFSGLVASVKAVVETLRDPQAGHHPHPPQSATRYPEAEPTPGPRAVTGTPFRS